MKLNVYLAILICSFQPAMSQFNRAAFDSINKISQADHQQMMDLLGIKSLRQGADGNNPQAPNAANYNEALANPFPVLPDPLVLKNGEKVTTPEMWWKFRRPEIVEDFDREIYGRVPANLPEVHWVVVRSFDTMEYQIPVVKKILEGRVDNASFPSISVTINLTVTTPAQKSGRVPVIMELGFMFPKGFKFPEQPGNKTEYLPWQQQVLQRGWGYAVIIPVSVQPDNGAGLKEGIIGLSNKGQSRKPDDWGVLRAWAWGASRAMDYFETDQDIDATRIGIEGHSRYGKAASVAMAYDARFAVVFASSSGEGGLKLHRRNYGEIVENLANSGEYHWMAGNFIKYGGPLTWNDLPVDAHELIALCAPRPVFISSGDQGDQWVDARGMFMAGVAAGPVYQLLGKKDLGTSAFPPLGTGLTDGDIAFRQHEGGHTPAPNWTVFLNFAARYFER